MAIEVQIQKVLELKQEERPKPFPKIMKSTNSDKLVYFSEPGVGFILTKGDGTQEIGFGLSYWNMHMFRDIDGTLGIIKPKKKKKKKIAKPFPKLMTSLDGMTILEMSKSEVGTVRFTKNSSLYKVGQIVSKCNPIYLKDFNGSLVIKNQ
tara:strand:+ start:416 stop:865 length:450 start_codon:yes stop_codon:yes gene_type:complete